MRLARRGFILGGAALLSGCATAAAQTPAGFRAIAAVPVEPQVPPRPVEGARGREGVGPRGPRGLVEYDAAG